ncbi:MAG: glycoside hydrolase family 2 TIM barrel-domain containing protein [Luteolibacter sp.]
MNFHPFRRKIPNALASALAIALILTNISFASPEAESQSRKTNLFDNGWRFLKDNATNAEKPDFDDSKWRELDLPHDWSIEGPFSKKNPTARPGGYLPAGIGWYRKNFTLPESSKGRRVFITFDGVMANSDVWINGVNLGHRPYGYVSFHYELTPHLHFGDQPNVIAVRADNSAQAASRWYTGAGIYRHVWLTIKDPVHLEQWSTFVTTPGIQKDKATVRVQSNVVNQSGSAKQVSLEITLLDPDGKPVQKATTSSQNISADETGSFDQNLTISNPLRWDIDHPHLYTAITRVISDGRTLDEEKTTFGIREFSFEAATGFWLNGRNLKLKGVCLHHDASALGSAVPLRAWERRLELLRKLGVNAIRTGHTPFAPEFLDLCDRMGFLVLNEMFDGWTIRKMRADYHRHFRKWSEIDTRDTVRRDRNHPSIILWSGGNEVKDTSDPELAKSILASLMKVFRENDPTRPVTQGILRPNTTGDYHNGFADMLDVIGQNYRDNELAEAHRQKPTRKILGTENGHTLETYLAFRDNPALAGQFLWTGFDYLGESEGWPNHSFTYGLYDRTGSTRPRTFQRQSWWTDEPMVYATRRIAPDARQPTDPGFGLDRGPQVVFPDWNPVSPESNEENVEVYSNCEEVELFLNDKSLGTKTRPADDSPRNWQVVYEPGTVRAVARNQGKIVATHELKTAGKPARIVLSADRTKIAPVWDDLSYVEVTVVDDKGIMVPTASDLIIFEVEGSGKVVAVDSANNASHESFQASQRKVWQGRCFALVKATEASGSIVLRATAPGLESATITLTSDSSAWPAAK